jgi:hypothetical protein
MGDSATPHDSGSPDDASIDLWKFFEQRGAEQKESLFKLVTWIVGFAAVILGFTVKEGFQSKYETIAHPACSSFLAVSGLQFLFMPSLSSAIMAGTSTRLLRALMQRETVRSLRAKSGQPAKKLKASRFRRSASNC